MVVSTPAELGDSAFLFKTVFAWMFFLFVLIPGRVFAMEPANPDSNRTVRAILNYLDGLEKRTDKRLVSGQFTDCGPGDTLPDLQRVYDKAGHWPALAGFDYVLSHHPLDYKAINRTAIKWWKQGGLVMISAHVDDPARERGGGLRDKPIDLNLLLMPGDTHVRWMKQMEVLADALQELQQNGVVVLWRPFHEMNGGWFWWGASDPEIFHKVWQQEFDYFTNTRKLNNLIWVYSPNHGAKTAAYYAGDHYVDLVGLDAYTDNVDPAHIHGYDEVAAIHKPFGFTEYGPHGPSNPPGDFDYRQFVEGVMKYFPRAVFFMSWSWKWGIGLNNYSKEFLENPWIVNRDDLPASLFAAKP